MDQRQFEIISEYLGGIAKNTHVLPMIYKELKSIMTITEDLTAEVAAVHADVEKAVVALNAFFAALQANIADPVAIQAAIDDLKSVDSDVLAALNTDVLPAA